MINSLSPDFLLHKIKSSENFSWMLNYDSQDFHDLTNFYLQKLINFPQDHPIVFLAESDSFKFLAAFLAAIASNSTLFLLNPNWQENEWKEVFNLTKPDLVFGNINYDLKSPPLKGGLGGLKESKIRFPSIMIPTGGTSGKIKFAIHSWQSLTASVQGFTKYFQQKTINSFCVLPLYHVSGLMQFLRSFLTGGKLIITSYKNLKENIDFSLKTEDFFISLVPTQLKYFLDNQPQWLSKFSTVLVGGSVTPEKLLNQARKAHINLALTYGMTETASGITILKPDDFLANNNSNGQLLPHAKIIIEQKKEHQNLLKDAGILIIKSESLFQGYYPHQLKENNGFITDDIGYIDKQGYLYILGRNSRKIITGGENVFPSEIEAVILATNLVKDIYILGQNDIKWGEVIIAFYVPKNEQILEENIKEAIALKLSKYKIPKYWYQVSHIPRNSQGKINRKFLLAINHNDN